jgi:ubiquinone/menaquinone biosynthesis C-methylase UbiE
MAVQLTAEEIARKYDRFARWYDVVEGVPDLLGVKRLRGELLARASGKILEVAAGTGKNFGFYPQASDLTAVDFSAEMLNAARNRAGRLGLKAKFVLADAAALPFPGRSFDTVVSTLTTCTFPDPLAALAEMGRVCRPDGRILLLDHGRSDRAWLARWQERRDEPHAEQLGCHWNREPLELAAQSGLKPLRSRRTFFGVFHLIEARPG